MISFLIYFHSKRVDNLRQTLRFLAMHNLKNYELVLLCHDEFPDIETPFPRTRQINLRFDEMWIPRMTNIGVELCSDTIFLLECDRILPTRYLEAALDQLEPGKMITCRKMKKLRQACTDDEILREQFEWTCDDRSPQNTAGVKNLWSGNILFYKADFYRAGGMNEAYIGYGWADSDMTARCMASGITPIFNDFTELHLWHPGTTFGTRDPKPMFLTNGFRFCREWQQPIPRVLFNEMKGYSESNNLSFMATA